MTLEQDEIDARDEEFQDSHIPQRDVPADGENSQNESASSDGSRTQSKEKEAAPQHASLTQSQMADRGGILYRAITNSKCLWRCLKAFPRTTALLYGVIFPLAILCIVSTVFGLFLARSEAPNEVLVNDRTLATSAQKLSSSLALSKITSRMPKVCMELFFRNDTNLTDLTEAMATAILRDLQSNQTIDEDYQSPNGTGKNVTIDTSELYAFMGECWQAATPALEQLLDSLKESAASTASMSFNWIRCFPGAKGIKSLSVPWLTRVDIAEIQQEAQQELYSSTWWADQDQLYEQYLSEYLSSGNVTGRLNTTRAERLAYQRSVQDATGGTTCELNAAASGWFWFTILSTVGFGNQDITTELGRRYVYTLGFASILVFAAILASAGYVVTTVVDDALIRYKLRFFTRAWAGCILWGVLYMSSMLAIAALTVRWKKNRLDMEDFTLADGFWFAFISSTTVGLGDIYLEPPVFLGIDLVTFPMMFLFSFVLASAFISKFGHWILSIIGRRSLLEDLLDELKTVDPLSLAR